MKLIDTIEILRSQPFYGGGKFIEIAKGKHQIVTTFAGVRRKIKRILKS